MYLSALSPSLSFCVSLMWQLLTHCACCECPYFTMEVCCSRQQLLRLRWWHSWEFRRWTITFFSYSPKVLMSCPRPVILLLAQCLWKHCVSGSYARTGTCCRGSRHRQWPKCLGLVCHWSENPLSDSHGMAKPISGAQLKWLGSSSLYDLS